MPQFNQHTPMTQSDIRRYRIRYKMNRVIKPIGIIGENDYFKYGFDGSKYYVTHGVLDEFVTLISLTFEEAKHLFDAFNWCNTRSYSYRKVSDLIKSSRKLKINGDDLFWHFEDGLS